MPQENYRLRNLAKARQVWQEMHQGKRVRNQPAVLPKKPRESRKFSGKTLLCGFSDPLAYYKEYCEGMTREALSQYEPRLYLRLRREGLLSAIPSRQPAAFPPKAVPLPLPTPPAAAPQQQTQRRRTPTMASAHLECFRIIPE